MLDCVRRVQSMGAGHAIFSLFQIVTVRAECEDGIVEIGHGIIIGIVLNPEVGLIPGWWYHVNFLEFVDCPYLTLPYQELVHESEIEVYSLLSIAS